MPRIIKNNDRKKNKSVRLKESDINRLEIVTMMHNKTQQEIMENAIVNALKELEKEYTDKVINRKEGI